jgi:hypothetical protein
MGSRLSGYFLTTLAAIAATAAVGSWARNESVELSNAVRRLADSQEVVNDIQRLRGQPAMSAERALTTGDLSQSLDSAMRSAAVRPAALARVEPQSPQRLGETDYRLQTVELQLVDMRLQEVVEFARQLEGESGAWIVRRVQLAPAASADTTERWSTQLTLTKLIYDPIRTGSAEKSPH